MNDPPNPEVAVFSAALELPADQREVYLDQACAGDATLRRQVEALLQVHGDAGDFFDQLEKSTAAESANPTEKAGDRIGRYKLLQQIGEGGCGVVYMAEQEEPVRRRVALKVIKLGMDTKSVIARFEAERQALALMDHPNIARVLDAGATDTGRPYFVMDLVRGVKITEYCDENHLPTHERLNLFIQVCQAIQHAHQKGIIHRDIKPSNILVTVNDGVPAPKVIDFGIAKATQGRLTDQTLFTAFEQFLGTPAYMSPEQAVMTSLDIDTRSDIYSLGVLLYELLTGKTPFEQKELLAAGLDEMRRTIRENEPTKPSTRLSAMTNDELTTTASHRRVEAPRLIHTVRGDLDWIVMKALEKDRARRYETANGFARDIQRHLNHEPVLACPPSAAYRLQKAWKRHKTSFIVAMLISVVLVAATGVSTWQAVLAGKRLVESKANEALAKERLADSEATSKLLSEVFESPDPQRNGRTITVAEALSNAAVKLDIELTNQPLRRAELQTTLGNTYFRLGLYPEAIALQEKIRDYYLASFGLEDTNTLAAMDNLAMSFRDFGRFDAALKLREETLKLRLKLLGPENTNTLMAMNNLANSYFDAGRVVEALKLKEETLAIFRKMLGSEQPRTLIAMGDLATFYCYVGRLDEAIKLSEQALSLSRKVNGPEHPDTIRAMGLLAYFYEGAGRFDAALKLGEETLTLSRKVLGPGHPDTDVDMNDLANFYDQAGRKDEALKLREDLVSLRRKVSGPEHPDTIMAMHDLALSYLQVGRKDEAVKLLEQVLPLSRKVLASNPNTLTVVESLGYCYAAAGRNDEAFKLREETLTLSRKALGPEHPTTLLAMNYLAHSYDQAGRKDEALKLSEEALTLSRKAFGPEHPTTLTSMNAMAYCYDEAGRKDEALKLREEVLTLRRKILGREHPDTLLAMEELARSYDDAGRKDEAIKLREDLLSLRRKALGPEKIDTLGTMRDLADSYDKAGRREEALKLREEVLTLRRKMLGQEHSDTLLAMEELARSYDDVGRKDEALKLREEAVALRRKALGPENADTPGTMNKPPK
jgi:serine/threonine protein kinase